MVDDPDDPRRGQVALRTREGGDPTGRAGSPRRRPRPTERWRRFAARYGWRAYALPVLVALTVFALATAGDSPRAHHSRTPVAPPTPARSGSNQTSPPAAAGNARLKSDTAGPDAHQRALASDALPAGKPYTVRGAGTFRVLPGQTRVVGTGAVHRYTVEVENGVTGVDLAGYAKLVDTVLDDPRSWSGHGVAVQRVDSGPVDFHITLTSAMTVRKLCGYTIPIETSCNDPSNGRVVLNVARWVRGDPAYIGDIHAYRIYLVNHEAGHALGHQHAHQCLPGGLAPVMMQQTIGLKSTTGKFCQANPWPYPPGARGAPGAEAPDTPQNDEFTLQAGKPGTPARAGD